MRTRLVLIALMTTGCSESITSICNEALREFYRCGGAPQPDDLDACIDRYETAGYACEHAFNDRLDCTYGVACGDEDTVCGDVLAAESNVCGGDPIVPPY